MKFKAEVSGQAALERRLTDAPAKVQAEVTKAMMAGLRAISIRAHVLVPRDQGELAASIHATLPHQGRRPGTLVASVVAGGRNTELQSPSGTFQLARIIEFGTQEIAAQPFLLPAYRQQKRSIRAAIRRAIKKALLEN